MLVSSLVNFLVHIIPQVAICNGVQQQPETMILQVQRIFGFVS
jgi:hypothetical protein